MSFRRWSMQVILSLAVPASVSAAEDDRVVDASVQPSVSETGGNVIRVMRDGKQLFLCAPKERFVDRSILERQLTVFLKRVDDECSLTAEQMKKLELAGKWDIRRYTQKPEPIEMVQEMVNGRLVVRLPNKPNPAQALETGTDFITTDSMIYKILVAKLTPEQKQKFEAFRG